MQAMNSFCTLEGKEGKPDTLEKNSSPGKQLVGLEPTTLQFTVEYFNH